jgi:hypothetical protein
MVAPLPAVSLPAVDQQLAHLIMIMSLLLLPVGLLLLLLLYKVLQLLGAVLELVTVARFDVYPMIKDCRALTQHAEALLGKAHSLADLAEEGLLALQPKAQQGQQALASWGRNLAEAAQVLGQGVRRLWSP